MYQIIGRVFFSSPDVQEFLPWIACNDESGVIHHNMLAREKLASYMSGLDDGQNIADDNMEVSDFESMVLTQEKTAEMLKHVSRQILREKQLPCTDQDVRDLLEAKKFVSEGSPMEFIIRDEDWIVIEDEDDLAQRTEVLVDWMKNIDPNMYLKRDVRAKYNALQKILCNRIVNFIFKAENGDIIDDIPFSSLPIYEKPIHKSVKVVYNLEVYLSRKVIRFIPIDRPPTPVKKRAAEQDDGEGTSTKRMKKGDKVVSLLFDIPEGAMPYCNRFPYGFLDYIENQYEKNTIQQNELFHVIHHFGGPRKVSDSRNKVFEFIPEENKKGVDLFIDLDNARLRVDFVSSNGLVVRDLIEMYCCRSYNKGKINTVFNLDHDVRLQFPICSNAFTHRRISDRNWIIHACNMVLYEKNRWLKLLSTEEKNARFGGSAKGRVYEVL